MEQPNLSKWSAIFIAISTLGLVTFAVHPAAALPFYAVADLGTLRTDGNGVSFANAINNNGVVVGEASSNAGPNHAFQTSPNMPINPATDDLGTFAGGSSSRALGVNRDPSGGAQAVGQGDVPIGGPTSLAFRGGPPLSGLSPLQDGSDHLAQAINIAGQVVGRAISIANGYRAVSWDAKGIGITDLNTYVTGSPWVLTDATAINDAGQIVGAGLNNGAGRAFLLNFGVGVTDLGTLPGTVACVATGINASTSVVGFCSGPFFPQGEAFIWDGVNGIQDLGSVAGDASMALSINNVGEVVGITGSGPFASAALWLGGMPIPLNSLIPPASGWNLLQATGINDSGQIVGIGFHFGALRGYRLDPPMAP